MVYCLGSRQTGCLAVVGILVIVVQPLPGAKFYSHHAQQVIAEVVTVFTFYHKGCIAPFMNLGQDLRVCQSPFVVILLSVAPVLSQRGVCLIYLREDGSINGLQDLIRSILFLLFQPLYGRLQRVRVYLVPKLGLHQRGLQQLAIRLFAQCLILNGFQVLQGCTRQVFLLILIDLVPQLLIGLSKNTGCQE